MIKIDRGRKNTVKQGQNTEDGFDPTGSAEKMACHRLGRADRNAKRLFAEYPFDRSGLNGIGHRGRTMRIDIPDLIAIDSRIFDG